VVAVALAGRFPRALPWASSWGWEAGSCARSWTTGMNANGS
jgi:hypothetical protein